MIKVAQCWDDGVINDARVADLCRKYGAKATFNLCPGSHLKKHRITEGWFFKDNYCPGRLAWDEVRDVYNGFEVASHTMCHCNAAEVDAKMFLEQAVSAKRVLEDHFCRPCNGFAWPYGASTEETRDLLRHAGFAYGRTTGYVEHVIPCGDPMELHSNCHFQNPEFWTIFEKAKSCGVFYFWGHSYEMMNDEPLWAEYEDKLQRLSANPEVKWVNVVDLVKN